MKRLFSAYAVVLTVMLVLETFWFAIVVERLYRPELGNLLTDDVRILPAVVFYMLYPLAVVILAVRPLDAMNSSIACLGRGFLLGAAAYGAYELTNLATLNGWSSLITVVDLTWGSILTAAAAFLSSVVINRLFENHTA